MRLSSRSGPPWLVLALSLVSCSGRTLTAILPPLEDASVPSGGDDVQVEPVIDARPDAVAVESDAAKVDAFVPPEEDDCSATVPATLRAPVPPMGWNGWNTFACTAAANEETVRTAAGWVASTLRGPYQYVNVDDCWQGARATDNTPTADATRYPSGIKALADFVHGKGLKFGLYSTVALCYPGRTGSQNFEDKDAQTYASWTVDYLKYNNCEQVDREPQFERMAAALASTGRPVVLSVSTGVTVDPFAEWMTKPDFQLHRTSSTISASWDTIMNILEVNALLAAWARPGSFNDPDMLEVGNGMLTDAENRAHFTLWAIMAAPLLAGNDLSKMTSATSTILTNPEVIALDQDGLGLQGVRLREGDLQVFAKPLASCGARGVVFFNRGTTAMPMSIKLSEIWLGPGSATVHDLWSHADLDPVTDTIKVMVEPHDVRALRVTGVEAPRPRGTAYLSDVPYTYAVSRYGPVEKDTSNGELAANDGHTMKIGGRAFKKGLGVHAPSLLRYRLNKKCTLFTAQVGVDDETAGKGSVDFQVWADGEKLYDSNTLLANAQPKSVEVTVTGRSELRLLVTTANNNDSGDHADWADAQIQCAP